VAELLSCVKNSKWRLSAILNYCVNHSRSLTGNRKPVFKFRVDQFCSLNDTVNRLFWKFTLKRLFGPPKFTFWGFWHLNNIFHHRDPQKAPPWRETLPKSHDAS